MPIANLAKIFALKCQAMFTNGAYSTKKYSHCRNVRQQDHVQQLTWASNFTEFLRKIQGLRQCPTYHRTWNGDVNAVGYVYFFGFHFKQKGSTAIALFYPESLLGSPTGLASRASYDSKDCSIECLRCPCHWISWSYSSS